MHEVELDLLRRPIVDTKLPAPRGVRLRRLQDTLIIEPLPATPSDEHPLLDTEPRRALRPENGRVSGLMAPPAQIQIGLRPRRRRSRRQAHPNRPNLDAPHRTGIRELNRKPLLVDDLHRGAHPFPESIQPNLATSIARVSSRAAAFLGASPAHGRPNSPSRL